jgi:choline kinase
MVLNADNLLDPRIVGLIVESNQSVVPYVTKPQYDPEDMKISLRRSATNEYLTRIGKDICPEEAHGEAIGIRRFTQPVAFSLITELVNLVRSETGRAGTTTCDA